MKDWTDKPILPIHRRLPANWGIDATSLAQMYVDNVGGAGTAGLMLNPT